MADYARGVSIQIREGLFSIGAGGAGAGLTDGPIQRVGGGPRVPEGGGPIPGIEAVAVDPGGCHPPLGASD